VTNSGEHARRARWSSPLRRIMNNALVYSGEVRQRAVPGALQRRQRLK